MTARAHALMIRHGDVCLARVAPWMHGQTRAWDPWYYTDGLMACVLLWCCGPQELGSRMMMSDSLS